MFVRAGITVVDVSESVESMVGEVKAFPTFAYSHDEARRGDCGESPPSQ